MSNEHLSISYTETDSEWPAICICSDFTVPVTNTSFVKSFCSFVESEMIFKLQSLSGNKLSFKVQEENEDDPSESILGLYLDKKFVGWVTVGNLYSVFETIKFRLLTLKEQSKND